MADLKELLEPYRGKRGLLKKDLGIDGIRMLYSHPEVCGSPKAYRKYPLDKPRKEAYNGVS